MTDKLFCLTFTVYLSFKRPEPLKRAALYHKAKTT